MGRHSGFIACYSALAKNDANFVLIPEVHFHLHGPHGLLGAIQDRLKYRGHAVIVVAEGAGQALLADCPRSTDASGNTKLGDIGLFLKQTISEYFGGQKIELNLKYIDPSYLIRSVPANPFDSVYCLRLAHNAVHAAMCGRTEMVVGMAVLYMCRSHWQFGRGIKSTPMVTCGCPSWKRRGNLQHSIKNVRPNYP